MSTRQSFAPRSEEERQAWHDFLNDEAQDRATRLWTTEGKDTYAAYLKKAKRDLRLPPTADYEAWRDMSSKSAVQNMTDLTTKLKSDVVGDAWATRIKTFNDLAAKLEEHRTGKGKEPWHDALVNLTTCLGTESWWCQMEDMEKLLKTQPRTDAAARQLEATLTSGAQSVPADGHFDLNGLKAVIESTKGKLSADTAGSASQYQRRQRLVQRLYGTTLTDDQHDMISQLAHTLQRQAAQPGRGSQAEATESDKLSDLLCSMLEESLGRERPASTAASTTQPGNAQSGRNRKNLLPAQ